MGKKIFRFLIFVGLLIGLVLYIRGGDETNDPQKPITDETVIEDYSGVDSDGVKLEFDEEGGNQDEKVEVKVNDSAAGTKVTTVNPGATGGIVIPKEAFAKKDPVTKADTKDSNPADTTGAAEVKIYLYEWGIDISERDISNGKIVFTVQNNGRFAHEFQIDRIKDFGMIRPGETKTFNPIILRKGVYTMSSPKEVDQKRGMSEDFSVR